MPTLKLTKHAIDNHPVSTRDSYLWDDQVSGFGVKVTPKGTKVYLLQYRIGGRKGRTRRVTIGTHGKDGLTLAKARKEASLLRDKIRTGVDPRADADRRKETPSFADAYQAYADYQIERGKRRPKGSRSRIGWKPRTAKENQRLAEKFLLPRFGKRLVSEIEKSDIAKLHAGLVETPRQANLCLQLLGGMHNWLVKQGYPYPAQNPVIGIDRYDEVARTRFLNEEELARLGAALHAYEERARQRKSSVQLAEVGALRLLLFSGMRKSEVLSLEWAMVDLPNRKINLPDSKTGAKEIVLNAPAASAISSQPQNGGNPFIFIGGNPGTHLATTTRIWNFVRNQAGLQDAHLHDLRHTVASVGVSTGAHMRLIAGLLGHQTTRTTERYAHADRDPLLAASDAIGQKIESSLIR
ncbi:site-specific integrase [Parvularcula sp. IMCC14364]|uniref:tyrosine-type recombinase/integrase n=1 Tax=Parvularcula sp. IMCC14364 TaxID=3067902 RepID=UPI00274228CC|nr:site-specific integrase [Parvularcula sp. IMCC14364]